MGYDCPVCGRPQADGRHLADHLAMTALTRGGDHEDWLDEHVTGWERMGPDELGPAVAERAAERDYPQVFEDTTDCGPEPEDTIEDHLARAGRRGPGRGVGRGGMTAERQSILDEAREMTEAMLHSEDGDTDDDADEDPDADGDLDSEADSDGG
jgi:hypothetical protein